MEDQGSDLAGICHCFYDCFRNMQAMPAAELFGVPPAKGLICDVIVFLCLGKWREMIAYVSMNSLFLVDCQHTDRGGLAGQVNAGQNSILVKSVSWGMEPIGQRGNAAPYGKCSWKPGTDALLQVLLQELLKSVRDQIEKVVTTAKGTPAADILQCHIQTIIILFTDCAADGRESSRMGMEPMAAAGEYVYGPLLVRVGNGAMGTEAWNDPCFRAGNPQGFAVGGQVEGDGALNGSIRIRSFQRFHMRKGKQNTSQIGTDGTNTGKVPVKEHVGGLPSPYRHFQGRSLPHRKGASRNGLGKGQAQLQRPPALLGAAWQKLIHCGGNAAAAVPELDDIWDLPLTAHGVKRTERAPSRQIHPVFKYTYVLIGQQFRVQGEKYGLFVQAQGICPLFSLPLVIFFHVQIGPPDNGIVLVGKEGVVGPGMVFGMHLIQRRAAQRRFQLPELGHLRTFRIIRTRIGLIIHAGGGPPHDLAVQHNGHLVFPDVIAVCIHLCQDPVLPR